MLREKEFRPLGSLTVKRSDFRIIAATHRDVAKEVEKERSGAIFSSGCNVGKEDILGADRALSRPPARLVV